MIQDNVSEIADERRSLQRHVTFSQATNSSECRPPDALESSEGPSQGMASSGRESPTARLAASNVSRYLAEFEVEAPQSPSQSVGSFFAKGCHHYHCAKCGQMPGLTESCPTNTDYLDEPCRGCLRGRKGFIDEMGCGGVRIRPRLESVNLVEPVRDSCLVLLVNVCSSALRGLCAPLQPSSMLSNPVDTNIDISWKILLETSHVELDECRVISDSGRVARFVVSSWVAFCFGKQSRFLPRRPTLAPINGPLTLGDDEFLLLRLLSPNPTCTEHATQCWICIAASILSANEVKDYGLLGTDTVKLSLFGPRDKNVDEVAVLAMTAKD
ncbi:MAG: uncharacterized protein KVP18_001589 [Porospora cf. gigantea A]|uniref:uncharacterized protein n=1 Tax=Porospora cf. gigantea A TaxID=2853593 RepID=UPI00355A81B2|nr:MAG: hypothetical protein KVP18_001589 [Porospora cf. gigantea A]